MGVPILYTEGEAVGDAFTEIILTTCYCLLLVFITATLGFLCEVYAHANFHIFASYVKNATEIGVDNVVCRN